LCNGQDFTFITHRMHFARRFADQVALLAGGRTAEAGPSEQVFAAPRRDAGREFLYYSFPPLTIACQT
jgi:ABC-type glutathione transport system ATPase component